MSSLGSVCQSCTTPLRSLLYKTSGSRAEVVEVARLVPFETGVDTHTHTRTHAIYTRGEFVVLVEFGLAVVIKTALKGDV